MGRNGAQTLETLKWCNYETSHGDVKEGEGARLFSKDESPITVQCIDPDTNELFDGWTARPYKSEAKRRGQWPIGETAAQLTQWAEERLEALGIEKWGAAQQL